MFEVVDEESESLLMPVLIRQSTAWRDVKRNMGVRKDLDSGDYI